MEGAFTIIKQSVKFSASNIYEITSYPPFLYL